MRREFEGIGFTLRAFGFELVCYVGEFYLRIPRAFEVAWNSTGFYFNKFRKSSERQ